MSKGELIMKTIHLNFDGYWSIENLNLLPRATGVACLYRARVSAHGDHVTPLELLWLGDVLSAREAFAKPGREQSSVLPALREIQDDLKEGELLCVSFAPIVRGRKEAAEALSEQSMPRMRRRRLWNPFPSTSVSLSGSIALLQVPPYGREIWSARESPASA